MSSIEISLTKQDTSEIKKEITTDEIMCMIEQLTNRFDVDIKELAKKIALGKADGFSLNRNDPYAHLFIGNGSENISIKLTTSEKETKIKIPKSLFL